MGRMTAKTCSEIKSFPDNVRSIEDAMHEIQVRRLKRKHQERNVDWYSWLISEHPFLVVFLCSCLIAVSIAVSVCFVAAPEFENPSKGFEVRGTLLSNRLVTWRNILANTGYNSTLSYYPYVYARQKAIYGSLKSIRGNNKTIENSFEDGNDTVTEAFNNSTIYNHHETFYESNIPYKWNFLQNGYFCMNPQSGNARFVIQSVKDYESLWSVPHMLDICLLERKLLSYPTYGDMCHRQDRTTCCPTLSLPNYVTYLSGLSNCMEINQESLNSVGELLRDCAKFYVNGNLTAACWNFNSLEDQSPTPECSNTPYKCVEYNAVYSILHYLVDEQFINHLSNMQMLSNETSLLLDYTSVFLPVPRGEHLKQIYYNNFQEKFLQTEKKIVKVSSLNFGLKNTVFEDMLYTDKIYPILAFLLVAFIVAVYTNSIFVTLMGILSSASALFIAYLLYAVILDLAFFPFMNLMAIIVIIGIGADNIFVYCSTWSAMLEKDCQESCIKGRRPMPNRLGVITKNTLRHAARSMFVTGVTTACAFLSNYTSSVTAIKCFGVYAGLTVFALLFLSVTWLPAAVIIYETLLRDLSIHLSKNNCIVKYATYLWMSFTDKCNIFFTKLQLILIFQYKAIWLTVCPFLALCGCLLIFHYPKLKLPTSNEYFQYFKPDHLLEVYYQKHQSKFAFEHDVTDFMPITIIFGVFPADTGDYMNPDDTGKMKYTSNFNISTKTSQLWLRDFCSKVHNQTFVQSTTNNPYHLYRMCFIEPFIKWMSLRECIQGAHDYRPCCQDSKFPFEPNVFTECLKEAILKLTHSASVHFSFDSPGPRFDGNDTIRALVLQFPSFHKYTGGYDEMNEFYNNVNEWMKKELSTAPEGLKGGWFTSELDFYSLQDGLYQGTLLSIIISVAVVCCSMLLTTCNVVITLLSNVSIAFTIFVSVGILVLLRWELNILESVTISIAIGLSVDFTVHYGVAYLLAKESDR